MKLNKLLPAFFCLLILRSYGQWTLLPDPKSMFSPSNPCMNQFVNPGVIVPIADSKIIYTTYCTSGSTHSGPDYSTMLSNDDLATGQKISSVGLEHMSTANANEFFYYVTNQGSGLSYYTNNAFTSIIPVSGTISVYVSATAITPNYLYCMSTLASSVGINRSNKTGAPLGFQTSTLFYPSSDKLSFMNDSVGFTLAKFASNASKTTLVKIPGFEAQWQAVLSDSVDPINDFHISPLGDIFALKQSGAVYKSSDKGSTFTAVTPVPTGTYNCVHFANNLVGFVGGENGSLWKTKDGGLTWTSETSNTTWRINSIYTYNYSSYFVDAIKKVYISQQPLAIGEMRKSDIAFSVFPNPASQAVTIKCEDKTVQEIKLEVTDAVGKKVIQTEFIGEGTLDISTLKEGIYFLKFLESNQIVKTQKLVVSH